MNERHCEPRGLEDASDVWPGNLLAKFGPPFTGSHFVDDSAFKTRLPRDPLALVTTLGAARNDGGVVIASPAET